MVALLACAVPPITFDNTTLYPYFGDVRGRTKEGFIWQGLSFIVPYDGARNSDCSLGNPPSTNGYKNAVVSRPHALTFSIGAAAFVQGYVCVRDDDDDDYSSKAFIPQSVYATAAWRNGMTLTVTGHDASGAAVNSLTATINYSAPIKIALTALGSIYAMSFTASGGDNACIDFGAAAASFQFSFDNFVVISRSNAQRNSWICNPPCDCTTISPDHIHIHTIIYGMTNTDIVEPS